MGPVETLPVLVALAILGYITGRVADSRGHSFARFFAAGFVLFPVAIVVALLLPRTRPS